MNGWTWRSLKSFPTFLWLYDMNRMLIRSFSVEPGIYIYLLTYEKKKSPFWFWYTWQKWEGYHSKLWQKRIYVLLNACFFLFMSINNTHMASPLQRLHRKYGFSSSTGRIWFWVSKHPTLQLTKTKGAMSEIFSSEPWFLFRWLFSHLRSKRRLVTV